MTTHDDFTTPEPSDNSTNGMRARFSGLPSELLPRDPEIGDTITFTVTAECKKHIEEILANGERRHIANFTVTAIRTAGDEKAINPDAEFEDEPLFDMDDELEGTLP